MQSNLSRLSHDLRSPLAALKVAAELLAADWPERGGDRRVLIDGIRRNVARIEQLADDLAAIAAGDPAPAPGKAAPADAGRRARLRRS